MRLTDREIWQKWLPILKSIGINEMYYDDVAKFCETYALNEQLINLPEKLDNYLPNNLKIISKIKDLSKVTFMHQPAMNYKGEFISSGTFRIKVTMAKYDYPFLSEEAVEHALMEECINHLNEKINEGFEILLYKAYTNFSPKTENHPYYTVDMRYATNLTI